MTQMFRNIMGLTFIASSLLYILLSDPRMGMCAIIFAPSFITELLIEKFRKVSR